MTILGQESVAELRDLVAAKDYTFGQIQQAYDAFAAQWKAQDPAGHDDWLSDWRARKAKYLAARVIAATAFARGQAAFVSETLVPAPIEYDLVLASLTKDAKSGVQKGDLQELFDRLSAARGAQVDLSRTPQPQATDVDLSVYKATDDLDKKTSGVMPYVAGGAVLGLVGYALLRRL
jgi:hypothetical protein